MARAPKPRAPGQWVEPLHSRLARAPPGPAHHSDWALLAALERLVAAPLAATTAVGAGLGARRLRLARRAAAPRAWALERPWSSAWTQTAAPFLGEQHRRPRGIAVRVSTMEGSFQHPPQTTSRRSAQGLADCSIPAGAAAGARRRWAWGVTAHRGPCAHPGLGQAATQQKPGSACAECFAAGAPWISHRVSPCDFGASPLLTRNGLDGCRPPTASLNTTSIVAPRVPPHWAAKLAPSAWIPSF